MRNDFISGLIDLARKDDRVFLLTADLGFGTVEAFIKEFPDRFLNVGVAEQGMVSVATGLAKGGWLPYCYSIATFSVGRTWEFLRNGPVAHGLSMGLIGVGPGFDYGVDGHTHHALEDVGLIRMLPGARVLAPADGASAQRFARSAVAPGGLTYFRLARNAPPCPVSRLDSEWEQSLGARIAIAALGETWAHAREVGQVLELLGCASDVLVVEELGLTEIEEQLRVLAPYEVVVTLESHFTRGGLGSAVAEQLGEVGWPGRLLRVGPTELATGALGGSDYLWRNHVRSAHSIAQWCIGDGR